MLLRSVRNTQDSAQQQVPGNVEFISWRLVVYQLSSCQSCKQPVDWQHRSYQFICSRRKRSAWSEGGGECWGPGPAQPVRLLRGPAGRLPGLPAAAVPADAVGWGCWSQQWPDPERGRRAAGICRSQSITGGALITSHSQSPEEVPQSLSATHWWNSDMCHLLLQASTGSAQSCHVSASTRLLWF